MTLNGSERELPEGMKVCELLEKLGLAREGVAVEIDRELVPRTEFESREIHAGEQLEIVTLVGGG